MSTCCWHTSLTHVAFDEPFFRELLPYGAQCGKATVLVCLLFYLSYQACLDYGMPFAGDGGGQHLVVQSLGINMQGTDAVRPRWPLQDGQGDKSRRGKRRGDVSSKGGRIVFPSEEVRTQYDIVGSGRCRDDVGLKMNGYYAKGQTDTTCRSQCDVDNQCVAYNIWKSPDFCVIYGPHIVAAPFGWTFRAGDGAIQITTTSGESDKLCWKKAAWANAQEEQPTKKQITINGHKLAIRESFLGRKVCNDTISEIIVDYLATKDAYFEALMQVASKDESFD